MDYSNPEIPEGINVSKEHPLREFGLLTIGIFGGFLAILLVLSYFSDKFSHYIPFIYETKININYAFEEHSNDQLNNYLQSLADRIAVAEQLPEDMQIKVDVVDDKTVNAFASLGGQVVFFTGLLEKMPNENALAMVMAHEIAHIKHRHPIRSFGRGVILGLVLTIFSSSVGNDIVSSSIGDVGFISQLAFSRDSEKEADITAINALKQLYGHVNGAEDLFKLLKSQEATIQMPEFFSTHPDTEGRIKRIEDEKTGNITDELIVTSLPVQYKEWLQTTNEPE